MSVKPTPHADQAELDEEFSHILATASPQEKQLLAELIAVELHRLTLVGCVVRETGSVGVP